MRNQDVSIADVAMLSGFNDVSYFSREFKKSEGISPKEYKSLHETWGEEGYAAFYCCKNAWDVI